MSFRAELTPEQMLKAGIFGGAYFYRDKVCWYREIPLEWKQRTDLFDVVTQIRERPDAASNKFGVVSGLSYNDWLKRGWIHPDNPCGWFQWYCRYFLGRRHKDDDRQIQQWHAYARRRGMLAHLIRKEGKSLDDMTAAVRERQSLLQWGYRPEVM